MGSIRKEFIVDADATKVWAALRDFGALHQKLVKGFVTDSKLEGDVRTVTFVNGMTARERLIDCDDAQRRLVYSVIDGRPTHYNAVAQVFEESPGKSRFVWVIDILPNDLVGPIGGMMDMGVAAIKKTLAE
jgi:Polyketide cyclase / dehydrase and lipid transport